MKKCGSMLVKKLLFLLFVVLSLQSLTAQQIWGEARLNKSSVYVGEPVQVSVTVYTSTWFTKGLDLGNIKVNGAFSVYFRPVSKSFQRNGKNFAGVELIYNVFPFSEDNVTFPALEIEVESPAPGGYKGIKHVVKTSEKLIKVKPIPPNFKHSDWLVASSLTVSEHWSGNTKKAKVGDVLERTITRKAGGTVAELIPPAVWDTLPNVGMYPGRGTIDNYKSKTYISAQRTESVRYLFEKEGTITIPEKVFTWYHPFQKKLYKKTLKAVTIEVAANPDLGMLDSVRDSLKLQEVQISEEVSEEKPYTILGLSVKEFIIACIILIVSLLVVVFLLKRIIKYIIKRRKAYKNSELYYFNKLKKTVGSNDKTKVMNALYRWIDEIDIEEPSAQYLLQKYDVKNEVDVANIASSLSVHKLKNIRKNYLNRNTISLDKKWINP
ncbi:BatD family protein [Galbibacter orientalis]|uniref:BatD family protein n=1 Tax=Galbibacter orientalis TaxID=453852 RepID=UPI003080AAA6